MRTLLGILGIEGIDTRMDNYVRKDRKGRYSELPFFTSPQESMPFQMPCPPSQSISPICQPVHPKPSTIRYDVVNVTLMGATLHTTILGAPT
jgi:hypothetical protein